MDRVEPPPASEGPVTDATVLTWQVLRGYYPDRKVSTYVRPLPEHGVLYVKNPKAACSTLLTWLDRIHTGHWDLVHSNVHRHNTLPRIGQVGRRRTLRMLRGQAYRFSFVRHPARRFESVYWDKIVRARWRPEPRVAGQPRTNRPEDEPPLTFEGFLEVVEQQHPLTQMDPHWRPQHINLLHPLVTLDHVGRLESFDADLRHIRGESGLPDAPYQVRNAMQRSGESSVYDVRPDLRRRVEELYAADMELYGY